MYRGFNLSLGEKNFEFHASTGQSSHKQNKKFTQEFLDKLYDQDCQLNGSKIIEDWFPNVESSIFISHSHSDSELALQLSGWLKNTFGLSSFIDSCVWGYSGDLLTNLNERYSKTENNSYDYKKVIRAAGHVNIMLSTALSKMINSCEMIIFLNTPSSISAGDYIGGRTTESPWIYSELLMTNLVKRRMPREHRRGTLDSVISMESLSKSLSILYEVSLDHLSPLTLNDLKSWEATKKKGESSLDALYELVPGK